MVAGMVEVASNSMKKEMRPCELQKKTQAKRNGFEEEEDKLDSKSDDDGNQEAGGGMICRSL